MPWFRVWQAGIWVWRFWSAPLWIWCFGFGLPFLGGLALGAALSPGLTITDTHIHIHIMDTLTILIINDKLHAG